MKALRSRLLARSLIVFLVAIGLLTSIPMSMPDAQGARLITTFDDGDAVKIARFTTTPLPGEVVTVYLKVKGDVTVASAQLNASGLAFGRADVIGGGGWTGWRMDLAGDVDNDGYDDYIIAAPTLGGGVNGAIYVLLGSASGVVTPANVTINGASAGDRLGWGVCSGGDINNDGYDDVIGGAIEVSGAGAATGPGSAYVYLGGPSPINTSVQYTLSQGSDGDTFGWQVSCHGDLNNDGYDDVVVGAPDALDFGGPGKVYVYMSGPSGLSTSPDVTLTGETNGDMYGFAVHIAGDVNDDGYDDLLVGAPGFNGSTANDWDLGKLYLYYGSDSGINTSADWTFEGDEAGDNLGQNARGADDINGDGYDDIIGGAPYFDTTITDIGAAYVFHGHAGGPNSTADRRLVGTTSEGYFGWDLAGVGDANGDGYADIAVGDPVTANGTTAGAGTVHIYMGGPMGIAGSPVVSFKGSTGNGFVGAALGPGGDADGDGYDDVASGTRYAQQVYVHYGEGGPLNPKIMLEDNELWSFTGNLVGERSVMDFSSVLNAYIASHQHEVDVNGDLRVPLNVSFANKGRLRLDNIAILIYKLDQPTGLQAAPVASGDAIKLTWDDHTIKADDISKMAVEMWNGTGWEEVEKVAKNAKDYIVTGLTDGVQYQFRLRAFDGTVQQYSLPSEVAMATPADTKAPGKVLNVVAAEDRDVMGINISWDFSDDDTVNYEVWSNKTGEWEVLANVTGDTDYYVDTDVEDGPWYWYKVRAWDEVPLIGELSAVTRGRLQDLTGPAVPSNFQVTTVAVGRALRLTWDLNTDDTVAYSLESNKTGPWKEVVLVSRTVGEFVDTGLKDGTTYWYRLAARDESDNPSNYTAKVSAMPVDSTPPAAPANLVATARPHGEMIRLSWDLNTDDTTQYNVYMYDSGAGDFTQVAQVLAIYDQYDVGSLVNGETYRFRIKAQDAAGLESDWSVETTGVPVDTFPPAIPGGFSFKLDPDGGAVNLTWDENTDDTVAYRILQWNGLMSRWDQLAEVTHPLTYYEVMDLNNNEPYAFVVRAVDEGGTESPNSQRVDAIPKDITAPPAPQFITLPAVTNERDLTISGQCQPGATITLIINNLRQDETATCDAEGVFTLDVRLKNGPNDITAEAVDDSGLTTSSSRYTVRVDLVAPEVASTDPADGTRDVTRTNLTYMVYFTEDVKSTSIKSILREGRVELTEMLLKAASGADDNVVPRLTEFDRARLRATFEVDDVLVGDSSYTILIYDVEDLAGNPLDPAFNGYTFQVWTVEGGGGGGGGGGGDDGIGSLGWIIAAIVIIVLVVIVAFVLVSRTGTHEEIEVDRSVLEGPSFDDEPGPQRPDIQQMYSEAYTERGEEETEHHEVDGGLGDWLAEQERKSQEADEETRRLMDEMQSTSVPQEETGPIEEVPPDMVPESEYTAAYHMDTPEEDTTGAEEEADGTPEEAAAEDEADAETDTDEEDDAAALLDELEEELESDKEE